MYKITSVFENKYSLEISIRDCEGYGLDINLSDAIATEEFYKDLLELKKNVETLMERNNE